MNLAVCRLKRTKKGLLWVCKPTPVGAPYLRTTLARPGTARPAVQTAPDQPDPFSSRIRGGARAISMAVSGSNRSGWWYIHIYIYLYTHTPTPLKHMSLSLEKILDIPK